MANQASKKREKENAGITRYLQIYLVAINIWFFIYNLLLLKGKYCTFGMLFLYAIHAAIQGICYYWVMENCKTMLFSEAIEGYVGDMLIISCVVSFFIAFSRKWMWVYIIIPIYVIYLGIRMLLNWVFTPDEAVGPLEEEKSKRQIKREQRQSKHAKAQYFVC